MKRTVCIVGPTAAGKSRLAMELAVRFGGEIISADSRQVYRYMDIGTAKPTPDERSLVPHHLLDVVDPDEPFNLAMYKGLATQAIAGIDARRRVPMLVGGTGLYVWALVEGWEVPAVPPDPDLRRTLESQARSSGAASLHQQLAMVDPAAAAAIDARNIRRVIRALEVFRTTGTPFSRLKSRTRPDFEVMMLGLTMPREQLYRRIDERVDAMMTQGLVDEVRGLAQRGYGFDLPPMTGIGYMEIGRYLEQQVELETAVRQIKSRTHNLARRQYAWFSLKDARIRWLPADELDPVSAACLLVEEFLDESHRVYQDAGLGQ